MTEQTTLALNPQAIIEPQLLEKVMVHACSTNCKCIVTAVAISGEKARALTIHQCGPDHDLLIEQLRSDAIKRALLLATLLWGVAQ